jgi:hypothetical protein
LIGFVTKTYAMLFIIIMMILPDLIFSYPIKTGRKLLSIDNQYIGILGLLMVCLVPTFIVCSISFIRTKNLCYMGTLFDKCCAYHIRKCTWKCDELCNDDCNNPQKDIEYIECLCKMMCKGCCYFCNIFRCPYKPHILDSLDNDIYFPKINENTKNKKMKSKIDEYHNEHKLKPKEIDIPKIITTEPQKADNNDHGIIYNNNKMKILD